MAMKQTQTKLFDFSDVGLDFCAGSKNLFPDRFKKMLSLGYNEQTVSSVAVAGNQVTFTYGGTHGYVADRVLKVSSSELLSINDGEFVIDSVTENTVTMTIDGAPALIAGNFTTKVASLGWELVYEQTNIHVYKFKQLDESDLYLRLCFQDHAARRNCISPCIGKTFDLATGFITDQNALAGNMEILSPENGFKWEFGFWGNATYNDYTYSQGYSLFGKGCVVGSKYHLIFLFNTLNGQPRVNGFVPVFTHGYNQLNYPVMIGESYGNITNSGSNYMGLNSRAYIGKIRVIFSPDSNNSGNNLFRMPQASQSFLSSVIDSFNTTTCAPIQVYEQATLQHIGVVVGGLYSAMYASTNTPSTANGAQPSITKDIDLNSNVVVHYTSAGASNSAFSFVAVPIEEIKIV